HVDVAERGRDPRQRHSSPTRYAHILVGVLAPLPLPVEKIVQVGDLLAQHHLPGNGAILLVAGVNRKLFDAGRRTRQWPRLRRTLPQIGPFGAVIAKATLRGPVHHVDDPGAWHLTE